MDLQKLELLKELQKLEALKAEQEKAKKEKSGSSLHDLRTAFITKVPQGLKNRNSFSLNVVKIDVTPSNVDNLINWLRKNDNNDRADEVEQNKERFFDISIVADDGSVELFNSGILAYDKSNSLEKLVVKSGNGFDYYVTQMIWDASAKELLFT